MKKMRKLSVLMLLIGSLFFTGCDVSQIADIITKISDGIQKALPAIQQVVNTFKGIGNNNTAADNNTATNAPVDTNTNGAGAVIPTAGDTEDLGNNTTTSAEAEAALAGYRGGQLSPAKFAETFGPAAREASKASGVPASIILAQAALETGWGRTAKAAGKNLFGIKGTGPAGSISLPTHEVVNGRTISITAKFRKYNSWAESIADHGRLLQTSRYANCMRNKNNPDQFARELQKAGYATDPQYASKLISIMKSHNLYKYNN